MQNGRGGGEFESPAQRWQWESKRGQSRSPGFAGKGKSLTLAGVLRLKPGSPGILRWNFQVFVIFQYCQSFETEPGVCKPQRCGAQHLRLLWAKSGWCQQPRGFGGAVTHLGVPQFPPTLLMPLKSSLCCLAPPPPFTRPIHQWTWRALLHNRVISRIPAVLNN